MIYPNQNANIFQISRTCKEKEKLPTAQQKIRIEKTSLNLEAYQEMEQDQDGKSNERIKATVVQSRSIISQNHDVVGNGHDPEN